MESPSEFARKAFESGEYLAAGFITFLGLRYVRSARIKSDTQSFRELDNRVDAVAKRVAQMESGFDLERARANSLNADYEERLQAVERGAQRDYQALTRWLSRMEEKLDRALNHEGR